MRFKIGLARWREYKKRRFGVLWRDALGIHFRDSFPLQGLIIIGDLKWLKYKSEYY